MNPLPHVQLQTDRGAKVWLAMQDTEKRHCWSHERFGAAGGFRRIRADLQEPEAVSQAVKTSGAKRAIIYFIHSVLDYLWGAIAAMIKAAGIEFVVFLSCFIPTNQGFAGGRRSDLIPHAQAWQCTWQGPSDEDPRTQGRVRPLHRPRHAVRVREIYGELMTTKGPKKGHGERFPNQSRGLGQRE